MPKGKLGGGGVTRLPPANGWPQSHTGATVVRYTDEQKRDASVRARRAGGRCTGPLLHSPLRHVEPCVTSPADSAAANGVQVRNIYGKISMATTSHRSLYGREFQDAGSLFGARRALPKRGQQAWGHQRRISGKGAAGGRQPHPPACVWSLF